MVKKLKPPSSPFDPQVVRTTGQPAVLYDANLPSLDAPFNQHITYQNNVQSIPYVGQNVSSFSEPFPFSNVPECTRSQQLFHKEPKTNTFDQKINNQNQLIDYINFLPNSINSSSAVQQHNPDSSQHVQHQSTSTNSTWLNDSQNPNGNYQPIYPDQTPQRNQNERPMLTGVRSQNYKINATGLQQQNQNSFTPHISSIDTSTNQSHHVYPSQITTNCGGSSYSGGSVAIKSAEFLGVDASFHNINPSIIQFQPNATTAPDKREDDALVNQPAVSTYPLIVNILGKYNYSLSIQLDASNAVHKPNGNRKILFTKRDEANTFFIRHSAANSFVRFYVIYGSENEMTSKVHPCKNHLNSDHPEHIFGIEGDISHYHESDPHPSILVSPTPTSEEGKYRVQVKFFCRNSCIARKDLILVSQLEIGNNVVGRDCYDLKVCACPRRDYNRIGEVTKRKRSKKQSNPTQFTDPSINSGCISSNGIFDESLVKNKENEDNLWKISCIEEAKRRAQLEFLKVRFRALNPMDFRKAEKDFELLWKNNIFGSSCA